MIFLMHYDRARGRIVELRRFDAGERSVAEDARLQLELALGRQRVEHEVVLLEAASEDALRRTHRRYFENLEQLST
jgi:hypothetical protein